jgi:hypothetical protein
MKGPYGCKCQDLAHKVCGDGCSECNPRLNKWYKEQARLDSREERKDKIKKCLIMLKRFHIL